MQNRVSEAAELIQGKREERRRRWRQCWRLDTLTLRGQEAHQLLDNVSRCRKIVRLNAPSLIVLLPTFDTYLSNKLHNACHEHLLNSILRAAN